MPDAPPPGAQPASPAIASAAIAPRFLGQQMQIAFIVEDLDEALRFWTLEMGVGPFVVIEDAMGDREFIHRGALSDVRATLAFSYVGETQIELICQTNDAPSPYREFHDQGRAGLQHVAYWPEDYEAAVDALERGGFELVCSIAPPDALQRVRYYVGPSHLGVMLEIAPTTPDRVRYFAGIKALVDTWTGERPVRRYRSRAEFMESEDCSG